jgi:hypothetical protein
MTDWIRSHQARLDAGDKSAKDTMFQFAQLCDMKGKVYQTVESYQELGHPATELKYSLASAFYYAALYERAQLFSSRHESRVDELIHDLPGGEELLEQLMKYEEYDAPVSQS